MNWINYSLVENTLEDFILVFVDVEFDLFAVGFAQFGGSEQAAGNQESRADEEGDSEVDEVLEDGRNEGEAHEAAQSEVRNHDWVDFQGVNYENVFQSRKQDGQEVDLD